jgi:hypothetical protein
LAFIQAAIDDSASEKGDQRLFLAGYVNRAETWALFADAWQDELRRSQPIQYLRMTEAASRRGQFTGWSKTDRDEKLRGLMRVARHFKPLSFHCSVSRAEYWRTVTPVAPRGLGPHFVCCFGMVSQLAKYTAQIDPKARIEFIFDKTDGLEDDIDLFFDYMARNLPRDARKTISSRPIFRDDKAFTPLQAADTLAWHLRRSHEDAGSWQAKNSGLCNPSGH